MRPIKLVIEGINSFDSPQTLDFEAVGRTNLFCICGKTGAGKTTIFDSILFALYGKSGRGNIADIVNLSRMTASVSFEFEERGVVYRIDRTIKCKFEKDSYGKKTDKRLYSGTEVVLYKDGTPVATTGDEVAALVDSVIGIDMGEFKNVYLLEQGEYAEFLKKSPAKQSETVGKIFSLMRFGEVYKRAKEKEKEARAEAEKAEAAMGAYKDSADGDIKKVKSDLAAERTALTNTTKEIDGVRAELDGLSKARDIYISAIEKSKAVKQQAERLEEAKLLLDGATSALNDFEEKRDREAADKLKALREKLIALSELNAIDKEHAAAEKERGQKSAALSDKLNAKETAAEKIEQIKQSIKECYNEFDGAAKQFIAAVGTLKNPSAAAKNAVAELGVENEKMRINAVFEIIHALKDEKTAFDGIIGEVKEAENKAAELNREREISLKKIEKFASEVTELESKKDSAEKEESAAKKALDEATLHSHAAAVRAELHSGDKCPVCGGVYEGHGGENAGDVEACKLVHAAAVEKVKRLTAELNDTAKILDGVKGDYDRADKDKNAVEEKIKELSEKAEKTDVEPEVYAEMSAAMGKAKSAADKYKALDEKLTAAEPNFAAVSAECEAAQNTLDEINKRIEALKAKLGDSLGKTEGIIKDVREECDALEKKTADEEKKHGELTKSQNAALSSVETLKKGLEEAQKACPVDMPEFDEEYYNAQTDRWKALIEKQSEQKSNIAALEVKLGALSDIAEKLKEYETVKAEYNKRADRYATIAEMTKGKSMLNYVATEYIEQFTAIASDILGELSHGKYTMYYDAESGFTISDFLNDGKPRKTDTLSGGELFLTSLCVAIAIARAVGRGNNAFFFLDEGFGTLDDELIDTVYGALESLSRDCLVGVITHAEALIDRMPSRVEVIAATDTTGSRIEY
ncbi:MAG: SMC family ATPase [Clostridiales bacterium]|nr:SMC family ATPase [Clostridiales bacterium]